MPRTIATNTEVSREELLSFVRPRHHMVFVTQRTSGGVQTSPVTGGVDADGRLMISSYPERAKVANARRSPSVSVLVLSDDFDRAWVHVDGTCEVIDLPEALEPLVDYYRSISGRASGLGPVPLGDGGSGKMPAARDA